MNKWIAAALIWLLSAQLAWATPAATNLGSNNANSGSTISITTVATANAGDTIVVGTAGSTTLFTCDAGGGISDSAGNTYTKQNETLYTGNSSATFTVCLFTAVNIAALASGGSITWTSPLASPVAITAFVVTGVTASPLDGVDNGVSSSGFCSQTSGVTPSVTGDMLVGVCSWDSPTAVTNTFTQDTGLAWATPPVKAANNGSPNEGVAIAGGTVVYNSTATVTYNPTFSAGAGSFNSGSIIIALKASGGGGATYNNRLMMQGYGN